MTVLVALALLALGLVACGGGGGGEEPAQGTAAAQRGNLVVGMTDDEYILEGPEANLSLYPHYAQVLETLTYLTPDFQVKPLLAERWEFRPPGTWRFFLRRDVKFHDGQPLTAEAVKRGLFDRVAVEGGTGINAAPDAATVVDRYTIDFKPTTTNLRIPQELTHPEYGVAAPGADLGEKPVGTGPFVFSEYQAGERLVVKRNPDYWSSPPELETLTFRFYQDAGARLLALEAGDIQVAFDLPQSAMEQLRSRDLQLARSQVGTYAALYVNANGDPPNDLLGDVTVRKAIALGINRDQIVKVGFEGFATTDQTWLPPSVLGEYAARVEGLSYNPQRAKQLLERAGWVVGSDGIYERAGRRLSLTLVSGFPSAAANKPLPELLQAQLREIGVAIKVVETPDRAAFNDRIQPGRGDLFLEQGNQNNGNPVFLPSFVFTGEGARGGRALASPGGRYDALISSTFEETELDEVRRLVADALSVLIDDEVGVIPLAGVYRIYVLQPEVEGFVAHPSFTNVRWDSVSLAK
jgi:peptide/nickel transport system substrate-binding protein